MTNEQLIQALSEACHYTDPDAFVSDLALSAIFLPPDDPAALPDPELPGQLHRIWMVAEAPFRQLLAELGLSQTACSRRFAIPLRTVQGWALGERACPPYVRLMLSRLCGYIVCP